MENLLHILKLIKQTKCEKQAKLPSTLQSRYIQTQTHIHTNKTHKHTQKCKHWTTGKNNVRRGEIHTPTYTHKRTHTHVQLNIYSNNELRWPKCCRNRKKMTNKKEERCEEEGEGEEREDKDDEDENTHTLSHTHTLTHSHTGRWQWRKLTREMGDSAGGRVKKVQEDRIENENGSQSMHY